jgi:hypothetical protein
MNFLVFPDEIVQVGLVMALFGAALVGIPLLADWISKKYTKK